MECSRERRVRPHGGRGAEQGLQRQAQDGPPKSTTKHLAWAGAALAVVTPGLGLAVGAGGGAIVGHFHHHIPKDTVREAGELLESGAAGLIVVAVNKQGTDIEPLLRNAGKTSVTQTTAGNLQAEIDKELAEAKAKGES